jgi:hypothetical protein
VRAALFAIRAVAVMVALLAAPLLSRAVARADDGGAPSIPADASDRRSDAERVLRLAEQEDEAFAFARALAHYDEGRALDPGSPRAPRAESRAAILRAHAEGDFAPFRELERVRRDPALASDPNVIDTLVQHAENFPPGLVRVEVWVLAAEAYAHRLGRPDAADAMLKRVLVDPHADRIATEKAARDLVALRVERRDLAAAEEAVRLAGAGADPALGRDVRRLVRRRIMHIAAIALLIAIGVLAGRSWLTAARRGRGPQVRAALARTWKLALAYAAYVAIGGALLASGYEEGTSKPFLGFGAALVPLLLLARAWGAAGGSGRAARIGRASMCAAGALGAAFLVLEGIDVAFLAGMGL